MKLKGGRGNEGKKNRGKKENKGILNLKKKKKEKFEGCN